MIQTFRDTEGEHFENIAGKVEILLLVPQYFLCYQRKKITSSGFKFNARKLAKYGLNFKEC